MERKPKGVNPRIGGEYRPVRGTTRNEDPKVARTGASVSSGSTIIRGGAKGSANIPAPTPRRNVNMSEARARQAAAARENLSQERKSRTSGNKQQTSSRKSRTKASQAPKKSSGGSSVKKRREAKRRRVRRNRIIALCILAAAIIALVIVIITSGSNTANRTDPAGTTTSSAQANASGQTEPSQDTAGADPTAGGSETTAASSDTTAPVLTGQEIIHASIGSAVRYKSYVFVSDDQDPSPKLEIDNSDVNLNQPGEYTVIYTATDSAGNTSSKSMKVIVSDVEEPSVPEDEIYAKADELLASITNEQMSDLEKVFAVFYYVRENINYVSDSNHWEYKQEAYHALTTLKDSCYANMCLSKLLLERLGFKCLMLEGDLGYMDEKHYWNMVSIDGGENWYHYDSAWWTWQYDEYPLCMMTGSQAKDVSERRGGLYIYDASQYPALSETPMWTEETIADMGLGRSSFGY